jgi:hypothetical protein
MVPDLWETVLARASGFYFLGFWGFGMRILGLKDLRDPGLTPVIQTVWLQGSTSCNRFDGFMVHLHHEVEKNFW